MAPKRGRPAAVEAVANKKPTKADAGVPKLCGVVSKALEGAPSFPGSVVKMLIGAVPTSLALLKVERHAFQEQAVGMIGEVLAAREAALEEAAAEAAAKLTEATREREKLGNSSAEAEQAANQLAEAETAAKSKVADDKAAHQAAMDAAKDAEAKQASGDAELDAAAGKKVELEALQNEHLAPLVEGIAANPKESVKVVTKAAKGFVTEASLLETLPGTLSKPKDSRGTFDALVTKQIEDAAANKLAELEKMLSEGALAKEERAAAVASALQARDAAAETLMASEAALTEAKAAVKAGDSKVKEAKGAMKKFEPEFKKAEKDSEISAAASTEFKQGALKAFGELKERSTPPPPPAVEPPAEEKEVVPAEVASAEPAAAAA